MVLRLFVGLPGYFFQKVRFWMRWRRYGDSSSHEKERPRKTWKRASSVRTQRASIVSYRGYFTMLLAQGSEVSFVVFIRCCVWQRWTCSFEPTGFQFYEGVKKQEILPFRPRLCSNLRVPSDDLNLPEKDQIEERSSFSTMYSYRRAHLTTVENICQQETSSYCSESYGSIIDIIMYIREAQLALFVFVSFAPIEILLSGIMYI